MPAPASLDPAGRRARALALGLIAIAAILLAILEPGEFPLGFLSCPFLWLTGLPCPFCGLTRAIHHLLRFDCALAWYLNPLAFPILMAALWLVARAALEIATGQRARPLPALRAPWPIALAALLLLQWALHVYGAVKTPKPELLWPPRVLATDKHGCTRIWWVAMSLRPLTASSRLTHATSVRHCRARSRTP